MTIYMIRAGGDGPVKIGWTTNVERRLADLQTAHYEPLSIIRTIAGGQLMERWLHKYFAASKIRSEWFNFDPAMLIVEPPYLIDFVAPSIKGVEFARAVDSVGGQNEMARRLGVYQSHVRYWLTKGKRGVPAERVLDVVKACEGHVLAHELRPDIFPPPEHTKAP